MTNYFVAMGDSLTQGIGDEVDGIPLKSWVEHFAQLHEPPLRFTNLAKRGLLSKEIRLTQLEEAVALQPDLVSIIAGANDILKGHWNKDEYKNDMEMIVETLSGLRAKIIIANQPDFSERLPMPVEQKLLIKTQLEEANEIIQLLSDKYNLIHIDFWDNPMAKNPSFLSKDLVHPNSRGYQEIAKVIFNHL